MILTASILFAGAKHRSGNNHCYFCGADCDESFLSAQAEWEKEYYPDILAKIRKTGK